MLATSCAPASARSVAGGPGCQMSSQIVGPTRTSPKRSRSEVARRRRSSGPRRRRRSSAGAACGRRRGSRRRRGRSRRCRGRRRDGARRRARRCRACRAAIASTAASRGADERRPEQEILGRVAGDGELREEDEVGAGGARLVRGAGRCGRVAVEVADDGVDLGERESHSAVLLRSFLLSGENTTREAALPPAGRRRTVAGDEARRSRAAKSGPSLAPRRTVLVRIDRGTRRARSSPRARPASRTCLGQRSAPQADRVQVVLAHLGRSAPAGRRGRRARRGGSGRRARRSGRSRACARASARPRAASTARRRRRRPRSSPCGRGPG